MVSVDVKPNVSSSFQALHDGSAAPLLALVSAGAPPRGGDVAD